MKHFLALTLSLCMTASVVHAQSDTSPLSDWSKRFEELSREGQELMEGWMEELAPKLEEIGPALESLAEKIGDLNQYHPPEVLDNGDIIIRRKTPKPLPIPPTEPLPEGAIDL